MVAGEGWGGSGAPSRWAVIAAAGAVADIGWTSGE